MKVSDYIVFFLTQRGITDVFGYPGGMITYLMDSFSRCKANIKTHVSYHEQAAAFAACGYAQVSLKPGVAYATSGPGLTNLMTGICNAYFDSIPTLFITGQVNTYEGKGGIPIRQKGFQEMDVISMVSSVTKYSDYVENAQDIRFCLEKAFFKATEGRPGPVVLDIPMNIQRTEVNVAQLHSFVAESEKFHCKNEEVVSAVYRALAKSKRPCILAGAGLQGSGMGLLFARWAEHLGIPVVSSMLAVDILPGSEHYFGFVGAYGARHANFILAKSDLIISLGSRLDIRQTGTDREKFAVKAELIRIDVDTNELSHKIKQDERGFASDLKELIPALHSKVSEQNFRFEEWIDVCKEIRFRLTGVDEQSVNRIISTLSLLIEPDSIVTTDVGQNQVWVAQSFQARGQRILFSGGHGAMGYSLPAAIGAYYGSGKKVFAFMGDGGLQMNLQELQFIVRENLPVKIILLNNNSLGMLRHFQEMYFDSNYVHTKSEGGYTVPDFEKIVRAYGIPYCQFSLQSDLQEIDTYFKSPSPAFIEVPLDSDTYVFPKLAVGKLNQDQEPELNRNIFHYLNNL